MVLCRCAKYEGLVGARVTGKRNRRVLAGKEA
jgi:hypothetical protein